MKNILYLSSLLVVFSMATVNTQATVLFSGTETLAVGDPTQNGRLSRNAIAQDWTGSEPFPGIINTSTTYSYEAFTIPTLGYDYIQISVDSESANTFVSAYLTSYQPATLGFDVNWLGDAGSSGNDSNDNPLFFQVVVPTDADLVVGFSNTGAAGLGVGDPANILVEGFTDTEYDDTLQTGVPEPMTFSMMSAGLLAVSVGYSRRRRAPIGRG